MVQSKREFLTAFLPLVAGAPLGIIAGHGNWFQARHERPMQMPPHPGAPDPEQDAPKIDPAAIRLQNQKQIQKDVKKLYTLAGELKDQVEKAESASVLSLTLVDKAKEIEKLAKQIANLMRA
jgi:hypothetical protein